MPDGSTDLYTMLSRTGPMSAGQAVKLVSQVAAVLDAVHGSGSAHGAVSTTTIVMTPDGVAHLTDPGGNNPAATSADDIRALAAVLSDAVGGPAGTSPGLAEVIAKAMGDRPGSRYRSAGEFARAAEFALLGGSGGFSPATSSGPYASPLAPPPPAGPITAPKRRRWPWIAAAVAVVVALVAGLGIWKLVTAKSGVDLSKLDVGRYDTQPRPLTGAPSDSEARILEGFRLAEGVANPFDVKPVLDHLYGFALPDSQSAATMISGSGTPLVQPVLDRYGMIAAYSVQGVSKSLPDFSRDKNGEFLLVMLTSFPSEDAANRAAAEMDSTDSNFNPDNRSTTIPGYPQAKAHYRPDSPSVAATMASGRIVTSVLARSDANPNVPYLTEEIQRVFDLQKPLIEALDPALLAGIAQLPRDPDNMLSRLFVAGDQPKISMQYGSMGPHSAVLCADAKAVVDGLVAQAKVDRCAFGPDATMLRTEAADAPSHLPAFVEASRSEFYENEIGHPAGLDDVRCFELKKDVWATTPNHRYGCWVAYDRYITTVFAGEEKDVQRRAAAQYAILVNSA